MQLTNAGLYRKVARDRITVQRYARDIPGDRLDRLFFDHAFLGLGIGISILCLTFGWKTGLLAAAIHAVSYLMLAGAVNAVGHTLGGRPHENSGTNSNALALISAGEGLHNNHHAAPTSARFSFAAGQIDPGWWFVRILAAVPPGDHSSPRGEAQARGLIASAVSPRFWAELSTATVENSSQNGSGSAAR